MSGHASNAKALFRCLLALSLSLSLALSLFLSRSTLRREPPLAPYIFGSWGSGACGWARSRDERLRLLVPREECRVKGVPREGCAG